ncbi:hypothetical protein ACHAXA_005375 [Cyclostephanos tholiformis]|uniref:Phospholipase/carboxylesterase/thioesterase domain-containing protein n=1 Tax=Cyclostephanos tholiformis TaxID=382380 RepID=A0ABD3RDW0_9STRA
MMSLRPSLLFATSLSLSPHLRLNHAVRRVRAGSSSLHLHTTTRGSDGTIIIAPDDCSRHSASVILCHGLGDTAMGWEEPVQYLARQLPHVKFILPSAPKQPVTLNMGMVMPSWYDIVGLDLRSNEVCNGLDDSVDRIMNLVDVEINDDTMATSSIKSSPLDYSRIVLAGFSQGGALALYAGMTQTRRKNSSDDDAVGLGFAGIVVMSGYLPRSNQLKLSPGSENTPILHCHGEMDSVVSVQAAKLSKERISSLVKESGLGNGDTYELKTYRGLDHSVSMEELDDVVSFLMHVIPPICDATSMEDPAKMSVRQLRDEISKAGLNEQAKGMLEKSELVHLLSQHLEQTAK